MQPQEWKLISWYDISFLVPPKWSVGKIQGDEKEGFLRVDDPLAERIQLIWKETQQAQIANFVERHLHKIEKNARKRGLQISVKRNLDCPISKRFEREFFYWKADSQVYNLCLQTGGKRNRVVFLRILGGLDENLEPTALKIVSSLKVLGNSPRSRWAIFGLDASVPRKFRLEGYNLLAGHVRLNFSTRDQRLQINKFSLGQIILKAQSLRSWLLQTFKSEFKGFRLNVQEKQIRNHPGLMAGGERKGILSRYFKKDKISLYAWFCPETNNIFVILDKYRDLCEIKRVVSNVLCCH